MAALLDSESTVQKLDPHHVLSMAEHFIEQCKEGEAIARDFQLPRFKQVDHAVICGMGGSAIGGDLFRAYAQQKCKVPIEAVRNYQIPAYVNKNTLVITSSYSGNTEETLSAYKHAKKQGANIVAITTGGTLKRLCARDGFAVLDVPTGFPPRQALGFSFMPLLILFWRWGLIPDPGKDCKNMYTTLQKIRERNRFSVPLQENPAKQLAMELKGTIPVIYAGQDSFAPVATRWRCQLNENSKVFAHDMIVPEMNHNEILGWGNPAATLKKFHVLHLLDQGYHKNTKKRFDVMAPIYKNACKNITTLQSEGTGLLARMFSLLSLADFVSIYLAYLYKEDPFPIKAIDQLKAAMK